MTARVRHLTSAEATFALLCIAIVSATNTHSAHRVGVGRRFHIFTSFGFEIHELRAPVLHAGSGARAHLAKAGSARAAVNVTDGL